MVSKRKEKVINPLRSPVPLRTKGSIEHIGQSPYLSEVVTEGSDSVSKREEEYLD
jgi:hypothetical protein